MSDDFSASPFKAFDDRFHILLGSIPTLELLLENDQYPFAHEAGVFLPSTNELFITSNHFFKESQRCVQISKVTLGNGASGISCEEVPSNKIAMANGGVNHENGILFCAQGSLTQPSGLYHMSSTPPYKSQLLISEFYGRPFNSVNDVVVHSDGSIWFTDPEYGFHQGHRPKPDLPNQVYRYDVEKKSIRAMADGFGRPNGICFSPNEKMVYVTDTDWIHRPGDTDGTRASTIYAFDIAYYSGQPAMVNKRLFAMAANGIPDGIKCDMEGNVYSGCRDGINVWCPGGVLLGIIKVDGGASNFCFGREGAMYILNENKLWKAQLSKSVRGALLKI